jgi:polysaccharide export outer membrane protein
MFLRIALLFIIITSCGLSPGFKKEPTSKNPKKIGLEQTGVSLMFYDLNKINAAGLPRIEDLKKKAEDKLKELSADDKYYYTLGYGDVINISLTDIEDINGSYTISPDGSVTIPYVGQVVIEDQTKEEAQQFINDVLKNFYQEPETIVKIEAYNSSYVYLTGAIARPMSILLSEQPLKLLDSLMKAGYVKDQKTYNKKALLRRGDAVYDIDLYKLLNLNKMELNFYLRKDDVLHIQESDVDQAYAFGEFSRPGPISVYKDLTLTELLATQGINQATAKQKAIYVLREDVNKFLHVDIYEIDIRNPGALVAANNFYILPNDIVFIPSTRLVEWNKIITLLTPSESLFSTYKPYIKENDTWYIQNSNRNQ